MALRTDVSVDWHLSPRIITVASPSTEITIQDLHDTTTWIEMQTRGMSEFKLISSAGKEDLGDGVQVGISSTLQNAKLAFEARPGLTFEQCHISGGNLVAVDEFDVAIDPVQTTPYTQVVRTASSSATFTIQELTAIQQTAFTGGVHIDVVDGTAGTVYPAGTEEFHVNNMADAHTIAETRSFHKFFVRGNLTLNSETLADGYIFIGESIGRTTITINAGADVSNCEFSNATVSGTLDGNNTIKNCSIGDLSYVQGIIQECLIDATITLSGSANTHILDCWSGVTGPTPAIIDMVDSSGGTLGVRGYSGGLQIINKGGQDSVSIDMLSGTVHLESSVTAGDIVVRGVGMLNNNSVGATVYSSGLVSQTNPLTLGQFMALK